MCSSLGSIVSGMRDVVSFLSSPSASMPGDRPSARRATPLPAVEYGLVSQPAAIYAVVPVCYCYLFHAASSYSSARLRDAAKSSTLGTIIVATQGQPIQGVASQLQGAVFLCPSHRDIAAVRKFLISTRYTPSLIRDCSNGRMDGDCSISSASLDTANCDSNLTFEVYDVSYPKSRACPPQLAPHIGP